MSKKRRKGKRTQPARAPITPPKKEFHLPRLPYKKIAQWGAVSLGIALFLAIAICVVLVLTGATIPKADLSQVQFSGDYGITNNADGTVSYMDETYTPSENVINILFIGIDRSDERIETGYSQEELSIADTLMVASLDLDTGVSTLIMVPRDTMVEVYTHTREGEQNGSMMGQIATQYPYGGDSDELRSQHTLDAVSRLLNDLPIHGYITLDMDDIVTIVDAIGGVSLGIPDDPYYCAYTGCSPGDWVTLDGEMALHFLQYRDLSIFASCEMRIERQKTFLYAFSIAALDLLLDDPIAFAGFALESYQALDMNLSLVDCASLAYLCKDISLFDLTITTLAGEVVATDLYENYYHDPEALEQLLLASYYTLVE